MRKPSLASKSGLHDPVVAAVLAPCAARKMVLAAPEARAVSVPVSRQARVATAWLEILGELKCVTRAHDLYAGRGFRLASAAASELGAALFVVSAGLGLIAANQAVPSYGLTISGRGPESIGSRVVGRFDPAAWWSSVSRGPFATPLTAAFSRPGLVLVALTRPYARMVAPALDELPDDAFARMRFFGVGLSDLLPDRAYPAILPYDDRLHGVFPGTRADFAQRALYHFASRIVPQLHRTDAASSSEAVADALKGVRPQATPRRPRLSDEAVLELIASRLTHMPAGIQRTLRALRDEEGIACEQARFTRLYHRAMERESVG